MQIVRTKRYVRDMRKIRASAEDMVKLEKQISDQPDIGDVIPGLNGIRKVRFQLGGRGKRGGGRAIYFLALSPDVIVMVFAYSKADKEDMTSDEKAAARRLIEEWHND